MYRVLETSFRSVFAQLENACTCARANVVRFESESGVPLCLGLLSASSASSVVGLVACESCNARDGI